MKSHLSPAHSQMAERLNNASFIIFWSLFMNYENDFIIFVTKRGRAIARICIALTNDDQTKPTN